MDSEALGYAVLFSVPVAVGVWLAFGKATGLPPSDPLVLGGAFICSAATFLLVLLGAGRGSVEPEFR